MTSASTRQWHLHDAAHTRAAGQALGRALLTTDAASSWIITLSGELGAGKTTFVSGLLSALGYTSPVRSPTYTLIEPYELAGRQFYHLDLYRLTDPLQLEELGVRDLLQPGSVLLVEWPEQAGALLAKPDLAIALAYSNEGHDGRQLSLTPNTESLGQLIHSLSF